MTKCHKFSFAWSISWELHQSQERIIVTILDIPTNIVQVLSTRLRDLAMRIIDHLFGSFLTSLGWSKNKRAQLDVYHFMSAVDNKGSASCIISYHPKWRHWKELLLWFSSSSTCWFIVVVVVFISIGYLVLRYWNTNMLGSDRWCWFRNGKGGLPWPSWTWRCRGCNRAVMRKTTGGDNVYVFVFWLEWKWIRVKRSI